MIVDDQKICNELVKDVKISSSRVDEIILKAREMKGIDYNEVLALLKVENVQDLQKIFDTAKYIKNEIYGKRLVLFAPLYISNLCQNECLYCAFRNNNTGLVRRALKQNEIAEETEALIDQGHKRLLLVAGESYTQKGLQYVFDSIKTVYSVSKDKGNIRRVNVNIAPLSVDEFKKLHECDIGTYQIFQETYHRTTYKKLHIKGPKADYDWRIEAIDRAFEGGFDDVGIGVLFGLYDYRYEILALLSHIKHLEEKYGVGPHTISVPRLEPAFGSQVSYNPPYPVSDNDFRKIIAVLRIAVPYTGIILSTRETAQTRREAFELGVSQISAGSRTNPGGYHEATEEKVIENQFSLGDERPMIEVIRDMVNEGYIPSFCTGCYRAGRVGKDFMDLAKPGLIKAHCLPNAMFSFAEYMLDFGDEQLQNKGFKLIDEMIEKDVVNVKQREIIKNSLSEIRNKNKRDVYL